MIRIGVRWLSTVSAAQPDLYTERSGNASRFTYKVVYWTSRRKE